MKLMGSTRRRYSKEEFARRGDAIYENDVLPHLKTEDEGKFAAIDIESRTYEIDVDELAACDKLSAHSRSSNLARPGRLALPASLWYGYELKMQIRSRGKVAIKRLPGS